MKTAKMRQVAGSDGRREPSPIPGQSQVLGIYFRRRIRRLMKGGVQLTESVLQVAGRSDNGSEYVQLIVVTSLGDCSRSRDHLIGNIRGLGIADVNTRISNIYTRNRTFAQ